MCVLFLELKQKQQNTILPAQVYSISVSQIDRQLLFFFLWNSQQLVLSVLPVGTGY